MDDAEIKLLLGDGHYLLEIEHGTVTLRERDPRECRELKSVALLRGLNVAGPLGSLDAAVREYVRQRQGPLPKLPENAIARWITFFGKDRVLACDGNCKKAWGINSRPRVNFDDKDEDDYAFLADHELGDAPEDPGTYEGFQGKPTTPEERLYSKWCARECERSGMFERGELVSIRLFRKRVYNQPHKHPGWENGP